MGEPDARRPIPWAILGCDEAEEMADDEDSCAANVDMETQGIATTSYSDYAFRTRKAIA